MWFQGRDWDNSPKELEFFTRRDKRFVGVSQKGKSKRKAYVVLLLWIIVEGLTLWVSRGRPIWVYNLISHKFLEQCFFRDILSHLLTYSVVQGSTPQDTDFAAHLVSMYIYGHQLKRCTAPYYRSTLQALNSEARDILYGHGLWQFFLCGVG